jgi:hypothetical protein
VVIVTVCDQFVENTPFIALKTFGRRVLFRTASMLLVVTAVHWCFHAFVVALLISLAFEEGQNLYSILIDQLTC